MTREEAYRRAGEIGCHPYSTESSAAEDLVTEIYDHFENNHGECEWKYVDEYSYYDTGCNESYMLMEGTLQDNRHKHCPYCGKKIKEAT